MNPRTGPAYSAPRAGIASLYLIYSEYRFHAMQLVLCFFGGFIFFYLYLFFNTILYFFLALLIYCSLLFISSFSSDFFLGFSGFLILFILFFCTGFLVFFFFVFLTMCYLFLSLVFFSLFKFHFFEHMSTFSYTWQEYFLLHV